MKHNALWTSILAVVLILSTPAFITPCKGQESPIHTQNKTSMQIYGDENDNTPREDKAEVVVKAPREVKVGDAIFLDLSESLGGGFDYEVEPLPPGLRTFDNGKVIACGTGNRNVTYMFMVSCALKGDSDIAVHKVKVIGANTVGPTPAIGKNIVEKVKQWALEVDSPSKRDDAIKLAQSFASVAVILEQGTFDTPSELVQATATSNQDALGDNIERWTPVLDALIIELKAMDRAGKLSNMEDHTKIWRDVARGLREYAATL